MAEVPQSLKAAGRVLFRDSNEKAACGLRIEQKTSSGDIRDVGDDIGAIAVIQ
jgi:hypothetical protein